MSPITHSSHIHPVCTYCDELGLAVSTDSVLQLLHTITLSNIQLKPTGPILLETISFLLLQLETSALRHL